MCDISALFNFNTLNLHEILKPTDDEENFKHIIRIRYGNGNGQL